MDSPSLGIILTDRPSFPLLSLRQKLAGGIADLGTVRLVSGNERLVFLTCEENDVPPVPPAPTVDNMALCEIFKVIENASQ